MGEVGLVLIGGVAAGSGVVKPVDVSVTGKEHVLLIYEK